MGLVMELCTGGSLHRVIRKHRRAPGPYQPPDEVWPWIAQISLGLESIHRNGTVYRDLKLGNVVLTEHGVCKITDFGTVPCRPMCNGQFTWANLPPGSKGFVAPEILREEPYGFTADYYSLGVLAWVLFTGGLVSHPEDPRPPLSNGPVGPATWKAHKGDHKLLQKCITDPSKNDALPLPSPKHISFVMSLTNDNPKKRCTDVRSQPAMVDLNLPSADASLEEVNRWVSSFASAPPVC